MVAYTYILAGERNKTLYVGVTSDLIKRIYQHKNGVTGGFTKKYNVHMLVYYEVFDRIEDAIQREKTIKHVGRKQKTALIEKENSGWNDLYPSIL